MKRIVFMGTPAIAVRSLQALLEAGYLVVGVITVPDKPAGRGKLLQTSEIKKFALENKIPLLQPEKLKDPSFLSQLKDWNADLQVVVAFRMLPPEVWSMPPLGTINMHASLLPNYRGAAPINHAIINGEKESGVTTFLLNHQIDTGDVLFSEKISLDEKENAGSLHDKLMEIGAHLLVKTVDALCQGKVTPHKQENILGTIHPAPKIFKADCEIDWTKDSKTILQHIRGLSPYPTAFSRLNDELSVKIFDAENPQNPSTIAPVGSIRISPNKEIFVQCGDRKELLLTEIQVSGKKKMPIHDLLRGLNWEQFDGFLPKICPKKID